MPIVVISTIDQVMSNNIISRLGIKKIKSVLQKVYTKRELSF